MKKETLFAMVILVMFSSFLFAKDERLEALLSKEELEAVQLEAARLDRHSLKSDLQGGDMKTSEEQEKVEKEKEKVAPPVKKSQSSSYSRDYRRYSPGSNSPGDAFKSSPAQRAFGK